MAESGQTYKTHVRFFPPFHFFVAPVLLINVFVTAWLLYRAPSGLGVWQLIVAAALLMTAFTARVMALAVQDRVIRLEMRMRMRELLPAELQARIPEITREQCVGLRFASDAELTALVRKVLAGELKTTADIKRQVSQWQGDYLRA
ncbi:MAG TPA: DUF6526 family protein [Vicinamibacterales bacterium]|jgi:hypothetical protein